MATIEAVGETPGGMPSEIPPESPTETPCEAPRGAPRAELRVRALFVFLVLAFALSWHPWAIALAQHRTSGPNPLGVFLAALIAAAVMAG